VVGAHVISPAVRVGVARRPGIPGRALAAV
jgi:hypothetical protein